MNELTIAFLITSLAYLVTGSAPPVFAHYVLKVQFIGGVWIGVLIGIIGSVIGGLGATLIERIPDMLVVANSVDILPPLIASIILTLAYGGISKTNEQ